MGRRKKKRYSSGISAFLEKELQKLSKLAHIEKEEARKGIREEVKFNKQFQDRFALEAQKLKEDIENGTITLDYFTTPTENNSVKKKKGEGPVRAFIATFKKHKEYAWIIFAISRAKAIYGALKGLKDYYFSNFSPDQSPVTIYETQVKRIPELDKYSEEKKVPIAELLKIKFTFNCCVCDKPISLKEYKKDKAFVIEGEGDAVPFAKGKLICEECMKLL